MEPTRPGSWHTRSPAGSLSLLALSVSWVNRRKALIVDLARPSLRARSIGLYYYLIRSVAIAPAAFVGGLLWNLAPTLPFYFAAGIGVIGTAAFALTVDEPQAG